MDKQYIRNASEAALKAGNAILKLQKENSINFRKKPDGSSQTDGDIIGEKIIKDHLISAFPEHGFIGEEQENNVKGNEYAWVCDPIDGTWSFVNGEATWAISIALKRNEKTIVGVVYNPATDQLFSAAENTVSLMNNMELPIQLDKNAGNVINYQVDSLIEKDLVAINNLKKNHHVNKIISTGGSPAYNLAMVATGIHSAFIVSGTWPYAEWDIAAGIIILKQSGGQVEFLHDGKIMIAAKNKEYLDSIISELKKYGFGK